MDGHRVHTSRHGLGWYLAELLLVRVVLVEAVDHLACDALGADARQLGDLLHLGAVGVQRAELAAGVPEQNQEVVGLGFLHFLQYLVLRALVDLPRQAAVGQSVLDNVLVRFGAGLLVQLWSSVLCVGCNRRGGGSIFPVLFTIPAAGATRGEEAVCRVRSRRSLLGVNTVAVSQGEGSQGQAGD